MPSDPDLNPPSHMRWQISLRSLLIAVAVIAMSLGLRWSTWVPVVFAVGLLWQARDIRRAMDLANWSEDRSRVRMAWHIAWMWRIVAAGLLMVNWVHEPWMSRSGAHTSADEMLFLAWRESFEYFLILIPLAAGLGGTQLLRPSTQITRCLEWLGRGAGLMLAGFSLVSVSMIPALVHLAIRGIEHARPTHFLGRVINESDAFTYSHLSDLVRIASYIALTLSILGACLLMAATVRKRTPRSFHWALWSCWLLCTLASLAFAAWVRCRGFFLLSPLLAVAGPDEPFWEVAFTYASFSTLFILAATWHLHCRRVDNTDDATLRWWNTDCPYLHERRIVLICVIGTIVASWDWRSSSIQDWLNDKLSDPAFLLSAAAVWLACRGVIVRRSPERIAAMERLPRVSLAELIATAGAVGLSLLALTESIQWASFLFWIN